MTHVFWILAAVVAFALTLCGPAVGREYVQATFRVTSSIDGEPQPCYFVPAGGEEPRPLFVSLHTWSNHFNTCDLSAWEEEARLRDWHYLQPEFRGPNMRPEACGSRLAKQDILDAVDYVVAHYDVDEDRIYIGGASGGGHMTLVMAAHAPGRWAAASAWCPITDLAAWHAESKAMDSKYWRDVEAVVQGAPGSSPEVDRQLRMRSPLHLLSEARNLPIEIATGIHDGHTGSVPVHHTLDAFNVLAGVHGAKAVTQAGIDTLSAEEPLDGPVEHDETFGRKLHLRRYAGPCRVSIFEGGHEGIAPAAFAWLENHQRGAGKQEP